MRNAPWWVCSTFEDVDDVTYAWSTMYNGIVTKHIKKRKAKIRTNSLPWVNSCIRKLMNKRYKLLQQSDGTDKTTGSWKEYRKVRNQVTTMVRKADTKYCKSNLRKRQQHENFGKFTEKPQNKDKYSYWSTEVLPRRNNNRRYKESRIDEYFFYRHQKRSCTKLY